MTSYLSDEQIAQLLRPINARRVLQRDGMSHLSAYDVRAHLDRIFGFARWSADLTDLVLLFETAGEKSKDDRTWMTYSVGYRATVRLTICAPSGTVLATYTEAATGDAINFPENKRADAHDFAIKTAESQALKRCATNLGDQFGLSLYAKGSTAAVVGRTLTSTVERSADAVDEHVTEVVTESETADPEPDVHEQSGAPTETVDVDARQLRVADLTAQLHAASTRAAVSGIAMQVSKERLHQALTYDLDENALTLGALVDGALKRVARRGAA